MLAPERRVADIGRARIAVLAARCRAADAAAAAALVVRRAGAAVLAADAVLLGRVAAHTGEPVAQAGVVALVRQRADHQIRAAAAAALAGVGLGALVAVVAASAVGRRRVAANAGAAIANAGVVALIQGIADHRIGAGAGAVLAGIRLRALVAVAALGAVGLGAVDAQAGRRGAGRGVALIQGIADHRIGAGAGAVLAGIRLRALVAVAAVRAVVRHREGAAVRRIAEVVGTDVVVIAHHRAADAGALDAHVVLRTRAAVAALRAVGQSDRAAARGHIAGVGCASVLVIADQPDALAASPHALVQRRAGVAVVALRSRQHHLMRAAAAAAGVRGAIILVVAVQRASAQASAVAADIAGRARVLVIADRGVGDMLAARRPRLHRLARHARVGRAHVAVAAGIGNANAQAGDARVAERTHLAVVTAAAAELGVDAAELGVAHVRRAGVAVVAIRRCRGAMAGAVLADIRAGAGDIVVTTSGIVDGNAALGVIAAVVGADVAVVAHHLGARTHAADARVVRRTRRAVAALRAVGQGRERATLGHIAAILGAGVLVIADQAHALAHRADADIAGGARVAVVAAARSIDGGEHATHLAVAGIHRAHVLVVAHDAAAGAEAVAAGVLGGAGAAVVAGGAVVGELAASRRCPCVYADFVGADLGVGAVVQGADAHAGLAAVGVGADIAVVAAAAAELGVDAAQLGVAHLGRAGVGVVALGRRGSAMAGAVLARILACAGHAVVAGGCIVRKNAALGSIAAVVGAGIVVLARDGRALANAAGAQVLLCTRAVVVARRAVVGSLGKAAAGHSAAVRRARVAVVAHPRRALAGAADAGIVQGAGIAVIAGRRRRCRRKGAAQGRVASIRRARVLVVAQQRCAHAHAAVAGIALGAGIAVVAHAAQVLVYAAY